MRARDAFLLVLLGIILTIAVGGYLFYEYSSKSDSKKKLAGNSQQKESTIDTNKQPSNNTSSSGLQVMGVNETAPLSGNARQSQQLPGPEEFGQYDQYAKEEGILYVDIVKGTGEEIKAGDTAVMLYKGWLTDGQLFDQTKKGEDGKFQAFSFQLGSRQVIAGWEQGVSGMKTGGKRRLIIPPAFGYGESGQGPIPGNAVLVFDVELAQINPSIPVEGP